MKTLTQPLSVSLALTLAAACGGGSAQSEPQTPASSAKAEEVDYYNPDVRMMAEVGALPEQAVVDAFQEALPDLQRCWQEGVSRVEFLGGEIEFYIKVNHARQVAHIHAQRSSIGDRNTELCMFDVLRSASWPAPVDGKVGIATNSFAFEMYGDVRPPAVWDGGRVSETMTELEPQLGECKGGRGGQFTATLYVDTDGSVMGASVTPPDESGEDAVDCLVGALREAAYESPGSWPAKVSFYL